MNNEILPNDAIICIDKTNPLWELRVVVGDRWYAQQGLTITDFRDGKMTEKEKPKRRLKKDWIADINLVLNEEIKGLDKCTIDTLSQLYSAITKE